MTASSAFSFTCASTPAVNLPQLLPNALQRLQPDIFLAGMARVSPPFCKPSSSVAPSWVPFLQQGHFFDFPESPWHCVVAVRVTIAPIWLHKELRAYFNAMLGPFECLPLPQQCTLLSTTMYFAVAMSSQFSMAERAFLPSEYSLQTNRHKSDVISTAQVMRTIAMTSFPSSVTDGRSLTCISGVDTFRFRCAS